MCVLLILILTYYALLLRCVKRLLFMSIILQPCLNPQLATKTFASMRTCCVHGLYFFFGGDP